jgi:alpha-1,3-rhamnosyl/mannosyltransferase
LIIGTPKIEEMTETDRSSLKKVAVDASCLALAMSGVGYYTFNLTAALVAALPETEFDIFLGHRWARDIPDYGRGEPERLTRNTDLVRLARSVPGLPQAWRRYRAWQFQQHMARSGADVIYAANYIPPADCAPLVPVVYDLSHSRIPHAHPKARLRWLDRLPVTLERARAVITISDFSKREIVELMGIAPDKIYIAPPGLGAQFTKPPESERRDVLRRLGLEQGRYFLAIGNLEPRKNLKVLIGAYAQLPAALRATMPLVIGGGSGWGDAGLSHNLAQDLRQSGQLRLLGYVPEGDLPALYSGATAFCFPSLYEGFGMPVVEAMACGAPVLASSAASVPEAAGEAGLLLNPQDVGAWTEAMRRAAEDQTLAARLSAAGPAQAAKFSWRTSALSTIRALCHDA